MKLLRAMGRSVSGMALPLAPGEARPPRPPPAAAAPPPLAGVKRSFAALDPFNLASSGFSWRGPSTQRPRLRSESGSSEDEAAAVPGGRPSPPSPSSLPPAGACTAPGYCIQKATDGRANYTLFWVVYGGGSKRTPTLAAAGVDPRQSGHFSYRSVPGAVPGTALLRCTSRAEVVAWLQAALGVNPSRVVGEAEARLPLISVADLQRLFSGSTPLQELPPRSPFASVLPAAGAADAATPPSPGGQSLADRVMASMYRNDRGAKVKPGGGGGGGMLLPRFRCSVCKGDHAAGDCPECYASPPPLIPNPTAAIIAGPEPLAVAGDALAGLGMPGLGELDTLHLDLDLENLLRGDIVGAEMVEEDSPTQNTSFNAFMDTLSFGGVSSPEPTPRGGGGAAVAQPVAEQHVGLEDTVRAWAATLSGPVTEHWPPPGPAPPGRRWVPLSKAVMILQHLSAMDLSVAALERTHISAAVGALRSHPSAAVATAAATLAAKWQTTAEAALQSATVAAAR